MIFHKNNFWSGATKKHVTKYLTSSIGLIYQVSQASPKNQNEIIDVFGNSLHDSLIKELNNSQFYFILADELTPSNRETSLYIIRFADQNKDIRELLSTLLELDWSISDFIGKTILEF